MGGKSTIYQVACREHLTPVGGRGEMEAITRLPTQPGLYLSLYVRESLVDI